MSCKSLVGMVVLATVFATKVAAQGPPPPPSFNLTDLGLVQNIGPPGGVTAVNASGHAIGTLLDPSGFYQNAFVWQNGVITNLGTLPGGNISYGYAINNSGQAVGVAQLAAAQPYNTLRAVIWQNGVITNLSDPNPDAGVYSAAYGINSAGEIVGYENSALGYTRPVIWKPAAIAASPAGASRSSNLVTITTALAHNFVAGDSVTIGGVSDPTFNGTFVIVSVPSSTTFTYSQSGADASSGSGTAWDKSVMVMLACDFAVCSGMALAINDNGQAVGWSYGPGTRSIVHPVVWDSNGTPTDIGTLGTNGESYNLGTAINNSGSAVGYVQLSLSQIGFTEIHAFLYQNGSRQDLGAIPGLNSGGTTDSNSTAWGINSNGDVVGISSPAASAVVGGSGGRAFLYAAGTMYDLTSLIASGSACGAGWQLENAYGINDKRQIVGVGIAPDRREHGYLLTPTTATTQPPATTAASVASSVNPSVYGQQVNFTDALSSCAASSLTPTGTASFNDGSTTMGSIPVSSGTAAFGTSALSVGSHNITASYSGDNNFGADTSPVLIQVVNQAATATTLTVSPNTFNVGFAQSIALTATAGAVAPGTGLPTGTVTFSDGTTSLGTAAVNNSGTATLTTSSLASGNHSITASYSGDGNFTASSSPPSATFVVGPQATHFVISTPALSALGAAFNFQVVALDQSNNPVLMYPGTVHFTSTDPQAVLPPDFTFNGQTFYGAQAFTATLNTAGNQTITATDTAGAVGTSNPIAVGPPPPPPPTYALTDLGPMNVTANPSGATAINSSGQVTGFRFENFVSTPICAAQGANEAFLWNPSGPPPPATGTFTELGTLGGAAGFGYGINNSGQIAATADICVNNGFSTQRAAIWQNGTMTALDPSTNAGDYSSAFAINTNGDVAGYINHANPGVGFQPVIWKGGTAAGQTFLGSLPCPFSFCQGEALAINDSGQAAGWSYGPQVFGYKHAVTWDGNGQPTDLGTFGRYFNDQANAINSQGAAVGYSQLDPDLYYSITHAFLWQNGTVQDLGTIPGIDPLFGAAANVTDNNSSAWGINSKGQVVGISAGNQNAVIFSGGARAFLYTDGVMYDLATLIAPGPVCGGHWRLEAAFAINDNGQIVGVGVDPNQHERGFLLTPIPAAAASAAPTSASVISSLSPSVYGQLVSFTVSLSSCASSSSPFTGSVTIYDGSTALGSVALSSGPVIFSTSSLSVGIHNITASYSGDSNFAASTSPVLIQVVNQAASATALTPSPNPSTLGQAVNLTAPVAAVAPGAGIPTGTVTFLDGTTTLGTGTLNGSAVATLTTSSLSTGSHTLTAIYAGDANFVTSTSPPVIQSVVGSPVNLSIGAPGVTYGTAASATVSASAAGGNVTGNVTLSVDGGAPVSASLSNGSATFNLGVLGAGSHSLSANYPAQGSFLASTASGTVTVNAAPLTITASGGSMVYGGPVLPVTPSYNGFVNGDTAASLTTAPTCSTTATSTSAVGTYANSCFGAVDANYAFTYVAGTVAVTPATTTMTESVAPSSVTYGTAASVTVAVASPAGAVPGNVTLSVDGGAASTMALSNGSAAFSLGILPAGNHTLTAGFAAQGNFLSSSAQATLVVNQAPATVTANAASKSYGSTDPALTATETGFISADAATIALSATRASGESAGTYAITPSASGAALANYKVTYVPATFTINKATAIVTATAASKTYGAVDPTLSATETGFTTADAATITLNATRAAGESAGTYTITPSATGAALSNYSVTYTPATFTINTASATITAAAAGKTYGAADPSLTATEAGFTAADAATITLSATRAPGESAGTYVITPAAAGAALANYSVTHAPATFTINKATATVTATASSKTYGSADPALTATESGFTATDAATIALSAVRAAGESIGTYTITPSASGAALANYSVTYAPATFTINKASATVTAAAASKTYGTTDPSLTTTETGFTTADAATIPLSATRAPGESAGTYVITPSATGAALANYSVTYTPATFTINKASATVTATASSKTYGSADPSLSATETGFTTGDATAIALSATRAAGENVGAYTITPSASGAALANYSVTYATATFTIDKATATVTLSNLTQTYAGVALNPTAVTVPSGLAIAWTGAPDTGTGSYAVTATVSNPNYTGSNSGTFVINPPKLTITANNATKVFGTVNPTLTWTTTGFVNGENNSVFTSTPTCTTTATTTSPIGSYPITCSGGAAKNYSFTYVAGTLTITGNSTGALSMGFWKNPNGQKIITNYCKPSGGTSLMKFLTGFNPFKDDTAITCASEAAYVSGIINAASCSGSTCNAMLRAQMLATALDVYFSTSGLGGNQVGAYNGLGASTPALGGVAIDLSSVCSMADGSSGGSCSGTFEDARSEFGITTSYLGTSVLQLLSYANYSSKTNGSPVASPNTGQGWYADNKSRQVIAKDVFDNINNDIAKIAAPSSTTNPSF
jgi:probable HAF family extracellular repeat protein